MNEVSGQRKGIGAKWKDYWLVCQTRSEFDSIMKNKLKHNSFDYQYFYFKMIPNKLFFPSLSFDSCSCNFFHVSYSKNTIFKNTFDNTNFQSLFADRYFVFTHFLSVKLSPSFSWWINSSWFLFFIFFIRKGVNPNG